MHEYENGPRTGYSTPPTVYGEGSTGVFVRVCPKCGRFVKADGGISVNGLGEVKDEPNATCAKCGRVSMPFEGWF